MPDLHGDLKQPEEIVQATHQRTGSLANTTLGELQKVWREDKYTNFNY